MRREMLAPPGAVESPDFAGGTNALKKYRKVGIVADNAKAIVGTEMTDHINGTNGAVEMIYTFCPTPRS